MTVIDPVGQQFAHTYQQHHGWLSHWLRTKLRNGADADDIAHDSFLRLLRQLRSNASDELREPRAWLVTVAGRLVNDHWRHEAVVQAWREVAAQQPEPLATSPEQQMMAMQALEHLLGLLETMPPRVREVFLLAQLEGLAYAEIARELGISIHVVQKAMGRALLCCYQAAHQLR